MSRDRIKEEIGLLKLEVIAMYGVQGAVILYVIENPSNPGIGALVATAFFIAATLFKNSRMKKIRSLIEKLD